MLRKLINQTEGQGMVEYALILVSVALVVIVSLALFGPIVGSVFSTIIELPGFAGLSPETAEVPGPGDPPKDCYGSLLLPIMVGTMGIMLFFTSWVPNQLNRDGAYFGQLG